MPNYQHGKVYKIWSTQTDEIYIGSTTQPLSKRIGCHRRHYKQYQNGKRNYITSFKILKYVDAKIELIENVNCNNKEQLTAREGHFIRALDCVNKVLPSRTRKEWCEDNKEKINQYHKQWQEKNKDKISQQNKEWYTANKQKILQKITCECGSIVGKGVIARHKKSKKHLVFMNTLN